MDIHFLTTAIGDATGGSKYDCNFFAILREMRPETKLYDDAFFLSQSEREGSLVDFNRLYHEYASMVFDCDYLFMNSRIYTRFLKGDIRRILDRNPRCKLIVIHHHNNFMNHSGLMRAIHKRYELRVLSSADVLIIPNQFVIDDLTKRGLGSKIVHLPSSFERKEYAVSALDNHTILFVGTIERRKGIIYGLKAFHEVLKRHPDYTFKIAGKYDKNDSYYKRLHKYILKTGMGSAVSFEGRVSEGYLEELYRTSDVFLFPSLLEGYGCVMIEAMGHGIPVVAFDNSAIPYTVVPGFNGYLAGNKNWREMADAIEKCIGEDRIKQELSVGALRTFNSTPTDYNLRKLTIEFISDTIN